MKKILFILCIAFTTKIVQAQQPNWTMNLNTISGTLTPNFGTASNHPINFYTNNSQKMSLSQSGDLKINNLAGTGSRFLQTDASGNLVAWTGAIPDASKVLFGDGTWKVYPFTLDGNNIYTGSGTKFGIGVSSPASELDVNGKGNFSSDLNVGGSMYLSNNFKIETIDATSNSPVLINFIPNSTPGSPPTYGSRLYKPPCNVFYKDPGVYDANGNLIAMTIWHPAASNTWQDLIQVYTLSNQNVLNMGVLNGDGIISTEPAAYSTGAPKLKINPGCPSDVYICEGGGVTKMFNAASIGGTLRIGPGTSIANGTQLDVVIDGLYTKAMTIENPTLTSTNKNIFEMSNAGQTVLGIDVHATVGTMLAIGQPVKTLPALALIDNSASPNLPFFNVFGDGSTQIITSATKALSIQNANSSNNETFSVNNNGYTEIKVYSPSGMPVPGYGSSTWPITHARVITVRDMSFNSNAGRDLFVVRSDGTVFAREIEINNGDNFPDYVFAKDYKLISISDLEKYINANKHLPGFEKASHYEENGVKVSNLLVKQQEKIEELTLYIIQLEKRLQLIEARK